MQTHFVVVGAGAVGCYVGARLSLAGQCVTLVGRSRVLEPLSQRGLTVSDLDGFSATLPAIDFRSPLNESGRGIAATTELAQALSRNALPILILLCVKGGATLSTAAQMAALCAPSTPVISLQNGVDNVQRITTAAPSLRALAGMVPYNVVMPSADRVHRSTQGVLALERCDATESISTIFAQAGLANALHSDMRAVQWGKLLLNLNNPVNALSNLPLVQQLRDRSYRKVLVLLQREALAVLKVAQIKPAKVATVAPHVLPIILSLPNFLFERVAARMLKMDASARSSMWVDVERGQRTEIDDLCGAVVQLAAAHGTAAPLNKTMCELIEAHQQGRSVSGSELLNRLHG